MSIVKKILNSQIDNQLRDISPIATRDQFLVKIDGYEGPMEILLDLVKRQKVDISKIAILPLVEQYLDFMKEIKKRHLDIAASYLVMAAWLTFLKSKLLLPKEKIDEEEKSGEELADILRVRLLKLDIMRKAADNFLKLPQLSLDFVAISIKQRQAKNTYIDYFCKYSDLILLYAKQRTKSHLIRYEPKKAKATPIEQAKEYLVQMIPELKSWTDINQVFNEIKNDFPKKSNIASVFFNILEAVRLGHIECKQNKYFEPIFIIAHKKNDDRLQNSEVFNQQQYS